MSCKTRQGSHKMIAIKKIKRIALTLLMSLGGSLTIASSMLIQAVLLENNTGHKVLLLHDLHETYLKYNRFGEEKLVLNEQYVKESKTQIDTIIPALLNNLFFDNTYNSSALILLECPKNAQQNFRKTVQNTFLVSFFNTLSNTKNMKLRKALGSNKQIQALRTVLRNKIITFENIDERTNRQDSSTFYSNPSLDTLINLKSENLEKIAIDKIEKCKHNVIVCAGSAHCRIIELILTNQKPSFVRNKKYDYKVTFNSQIKHWTSDSRGGWLKRFSKIEECRLWTNKQIENKNNNLLSLIGRDLPLNSYIIKAIFKRRF